MPSGPDVELIAKQLSATNGGRSGPGWLNGARHSRRVRTPASCGPSPDSPTRSRPTLASSARSRADSGLKYVEIRSAWDVNILDLDADQLATLQQTLDGARPRRSPASARRSARSSSTRTSSRTWSGCGTPPRWPGCFGAPYIRIFSFFIPEGDDPDDAPRRGAAPDARAGRGRRGGRRRPAAREREGDLRRHPAPLPGHRHSGRLAEPAAGLGPGQLRPGRGPALHRGLRRRCARTWTTSRSRTPAWPTARSWWPGPATARSWRPSARCAHDGFDGFFSLEPHLADYNATGGFSGAELWTERLEGVHRHPQGRRDRVRMSSTSRAEPHPLRPGRRRGDRQAARPGDRRAGRPDRAGRRRRHPRRPGRAAGRRARRRALRQPDRGAGRRRGRRRERLHARPGRTARWPSRRCAPAST